MQAHDMLNGREALNVTIPVRFITLAQSISFVMHMSILLRTLDRVAHHSLKESTLAYDLYSVF